MRFYEIIEEGYKETKQVFSTQHDNEDDIDQAIAKYRELVNKNQIQGVERNIDYWRKQGFDRFKSYVDDISHRPTKTQTKRSKIIGQSINLHEDDKWLIVIPLDKSASCFYGKNTSWCTTKPNSSYFEKYFYKNEIVLIYCLNKANGNKWAIAAHRDIDKLELFDINDNTISEEVFAAQTGLLAHELVDIANKEYQPTIEKSREKVKQYYDYLKTHLIGNISQRDQKIEEALLITKDSKLSYQYVGNLLNSKVDNNQIPEAIVRAAVTHHPDILLKMKNPSESLLVEAMSAGVMAMEYIKNPPPKVKHIAYDRYITASDRYTPTIEDIKKYPKVAAYILTNARRHESEARVFGETDERHNPLYDYALANSDKLEKLISSDPDAVRHALTQKKSGKWTDAEPAILKRPSSMVTYVANNLKRQRWPEGENALMTTIESEPYMVQYSMITKHKWDQKGFEKILQDPVSAAIYATNITKKPLPDIIEKQLLEVDPTDDTVIIRYAEMFDFGDYFDRYRDYFNRQNNDDDWD